MFTVSGEEGPERQASSTAGGSLYAPSWAVEGDPELLEVAPWTAHGPQSPCLPLPKEERFLYKAQIHFHKTFFTLSGFDALFTECKLSFYFFTEFIGARLVNIMV